ncbi:hypothetical protein WR164_08060 [Philodulcilactobacillus myokoensis]|uniref:VWA-like domain-containing protein n=1 Tax=Philodulcilactobacillus myokoensis TaxID=2929573 RepID=A0A9W6B0Z0_9LACO|nr:VWA-like domain-containing protein [Philodulcilactobacillus myokoensis]GLB46827.1 hypothetical protein WR164_08060 [Philodulcilactobacillus myokoensis]
MNFNQKVGQLKSNHINIDNVLGSAIVSLLKSNQFYGNILVRINRIEDDKLKQPLGLTWHRHQIYLLYSESMISKIGDSEALITMLKHVALHIIWLHPAIYYKNDLATQMGTDISVNQYLDQVPQHAFTLKNVNSYFNIKLNKNKKSKYYIKNIRKIIKKETKKPNKNSKKQTLDDHKQWGRSSGLTKSEKANQLKKLINKSWKNTNTKNRGNIPGDVKNQLKRISIRHPIDWKKYIQIGLGNISFDKIDSRARFNRRQAWRMDLMGQISNNMYPVNIFVDNSGSMGDLEISYLLSEMEDFLNHFPTLISLYSFDTEIHRLKSNNKHIDFKRIGGGGTRFQSIFDYINNHKNAFGNSLVIILTDGYGEHELKYYHNNNILWILTSDIKHFSVNHPCGKIITLIHNQDFKDLVRGDN